MSHLRVIGLLALAWAAPAQAAAEESDAGTSAVAPNVAPGGDDAGVASAQSQGFFSRFGSAYWQDWTGTLPPSPEAPYRGYPPPVTNPPFPFSYWPMGGTPTIGQ